MTKETRIGAEQKEPALRDIMVKLRSEYGQNGFERRRMIGDLYEDTDTQNLEIRWDESVEPTDRLVFNKLVHEYSVISRGRIKPTNARVGDIALHYEGPRRDVLAAIGHVTNFVFIEELPPAEELGLVG